MRKKIVAGNWKMNTTFEEAIKLTSEVVNMIHTEKLSAAGVILFPPFVYLKSISALVDHSVISLGAQNCHFENSGAFTGEISVPMLKSIGLEYVLVGHSERRSLFGETNAMLEKKVNAALAGGIKPVYCCGETLEEREQENHFRVIEAQISEGLFQLSAEEMKNVVIAYEPVWAIGTGKTASADQAQEIHKFIRGLVAAKYSPEIADGMSILYGGSVKPDNAGELFACPDIDGGLIGGAALSSRNFTDIVKAYN